MHAQQHVLLAHLAQLLRGFATCCMLMPPGVALLQVTTNKAIIVGTMADAVHCYSLQGSKQYSLYMPASIRAMQLLTPNSTCNTKCIMVALSNGVLRLYNDKTLVSEHSSSSPVNGLFVGRYAREDNSLVNVTEAGGLDIKVTGVLGTGTSSLLQTKQL
jgi:hypothetical protein